MTFGDYGGNGVVDAPDYVVWRKSLGQPNANLVADGNGNGQIDPGDYDVWRANFGQTAGSSAALPSAATLPAAVPESATFSLGSIALASWLVFSCARTRGADSATLVVVAARYCAVQRPLSHSHRTAHRERNS
jgi:hypothetical protein